MLLSARRGQRGQRPTSIGRVLYVERLTAGSTAAARKCLLITRKIMIPPPDSRDPPDGSPYFVKKTFPLTVGTHQLHLRTQGSASMLWAKEMIRPWLLGPTSYIFARKEVPDNRDPPGQSVHSVVILVANMYVHTGRSVCLQAAAMNRGRVRKGTCRSRGAHVACTRTYSQGARKENTATYVRTGRVSNAYFTVC